MIALPENHGLAPAVVAALEQHSVQATPEETQDIVQVFNEYVARGGAYPGVHVRLLSCHDWDAPKDAPRHSSGHRAFQITLAASPRNPDGLSVFLTAYEPGSDHVRLPFDIALGATRKVEEQLGTVSDYADDHRRGRWTTREHREAYDALTGAEKASNGALDALRAAVSDPANWPPIGTAATVFATAISAALVLA